MIDVLLRPRWQGRTQLGEFLRGNMSVELYTKSGKFLGQLATNAGYDSLLKANVGPETKKLQNTGTHDDPKILLEEVQGFLADEIERGDGVEADDDIHTMTNLVTLLKKAGNDPVQVVM